MKEISRDINTSSIENKVSSENKLNIIDIKPKKYSVVLPFSDNKLHYDKITLKNLLDFPIVLVIDL